MRRVRFECRHRLWSAWCAAAGALALTAGCSLFQPAPDYATAAKKKPAPPPKVEAPLLPFPIASDRFRFDAQHDDVVGHVQVTVATKDDTLPDLARRFNVGYEEIVRANPGVDPWLPGAGREIVLPTQYVLPDAPRDGILINVAAMRIF
jgi:L,D-transpeptidase ErfK/SrfK